LQGKANSIYEEYTDRQQAASNKGTLWPLHKKQSVVGCGVLVRLFCLGMRLVLEWYIQDYRILGFTIGLTEFSFPCQGPDQANQITDYICVALESPSHEYSSVTYYIEDKWL